MCPLPELHLPATRSLPVVQAARLHTPVQASRLHYSEAFVILKEVT